MHLSPALSCVPNGDSHDPKAPALYSTIFLVGDLITFSSNTKAPLSPMHRMHSIGRINCFMPTICTFFSPKGNRSGCPGKLAGSAQVTLCAVDQAQAE